MAPSSGGEGDDEADDEDDESLASQEASVASSGYLMILPVLFLEYVAIAVTKSLLPGRLNAFFGPRVYYAIGVAETVKGLLAFCACPLIGRVSDLVGRSSCLVLTVLGTTAPCWVLVFTDNLWVYVTALGLSGIFAATFTLVFAYIADVVPPRQRAAAYGMALATLGLSFTVGPPLGAFAARRVGERRVFLVSMFLAFFDVGLVALALPETSAAALAGDEDEDYTNNNTSEENNGESPTAAALGGGSLGRRRLLGRQFRALASQRRKLSLFPVSSRAARGMAVRTASELASERAAEAAADEKGPPQGAALLDPADTLALFRGDPFLRRVALVVLLYYSGVWALVTTIVIYMVRVFHMTKMEIGWLLSTYGLATTLSESLLVRLVVPRLGELATIRVGLAAFALQCLVVALARTRGLVFASISLSLFSNLVYPALSSLVSRAVPPEEVGETLGAVNGVKALTEGAGPLAFAALMTIFEHSKFPGLPYLANALLVCLALAVSFHMPPEDQSAAFSSSGGSAAAQQGRKGGRARRRAPRGSPQPEELVSLLHHRSSDEDDDEEAHLADQEVASISAAAAAAAAAQRTLKPLSPRRKRRIPARRPVSTPPRHSAAMTLGFRAPLTTSPATFPKGAAPPLPKLPKPRR